MAQLCFILGAGASAATGAPLMKDFLRAIRDLYPELPSEFQKDFHAVLQGYSLLQPTYAKLKMNYEDNIEELFATFEMIRILDSDDFADFDIGFLSKAIRRVIATTIEKSILYNTAFQSDIGNIFEPHNYLREFVRLINDIVLTKGSLSSVCIITFNYDLTLDHTLYFTGAPFDYCLDSKKGHEGIPLLKLHGSLNWGVCEKCKSIIPYHLRDFFTSNPIKDKGYQNLIVSRHLSDLSHCERKILPEPFIVPPTWNKTEYHERIAEVWKVAASELSEATDIFICGYSLPASDQFFRHLLAASLSQGQIIDRFIIVNPSNDVYGSFRSILNDPVLRVFDSIPKHFETSFDRIRDSLNISKIVKTDRKWTLTSSS